MDDLISAKHWQCALGAEANMRPQGPLAMAGATGLEPATSGLTGQSCTAQVLVPQGVVRGLAPAYPPACLSRTVTAPREDPLRLVADLLGAAAGAADPAPLIEAARALLAEARSPGRGQEGEVGAG